MGSSQVLIKKNHYRKIFMKSEPSFWQRLGMQDWFLSDSSSQSAGSHTLTPNDVYNYIIEKFGESINELSFADRVVFYHEFIICFNKEDYREFMDKKKGIFGLIVQETVKKFYDILHKYRTENKTVEPSGSKWVFRFVSHSDYQRGDMGFIGKLLPESTQKQENLKITFIPRQTGIAETFDVNQDTLKGFTFYSEGYYEVPYMDDLEYDEDKINNKTNAKFARFETILPDKAGQKVEYLMNDAEITVSGEDEKKEKPEIFRIPSEWVNTPHLKIKFDESDSKFYVASFGEKTILNEKELEKSTINNPTWEELPINSRMILNGIIGVNIFKA
jgi:hypothetical protein